MSYTTVKYLCSNVQNFKYCTKNLLKNIKTGSKDFCQHYLSNNLKSTYFAALVFEKLENVVVFPLYENFALF